MRIPKMLNGVLSKHARASGERSGSPQLMSLSSAKQLLLALLDSHEQRGGVSADHYCETPHYHPMAEGKYLLALTTSYRAGLLSDSELRKRVCAAASRLLSDTDKHDNDLHLAFGLNFSYKGSDALDRFLITSSIVAHGLLEAGGVCGYSDVIQKLLRGMALWFAEQVPRSEIPVGADQQVKRQCEVVCFSEQNSAIVVNVNVYFAAISKVLNAVGYQTHFTSEPVIEWVRCSHVPDYGWPYSNTSARFDLLHQCYIFNSLLYYGQSDLETESLCTLLKFITGDNIQDKFDLVPLDAGLDSLGKAKKASGQIHDGKLTLYTNTPARTWSAGEALVLASHFVFHGRHVAVWRNLQFKFINHIQTACMEDCDKYLRHAMHVAHGLACFIASRKGDTPSETDRRP